MTDHRTTSPQQWTIRLADEHDTRDLRRLAALDSQPSLDGPSLVAEVDHETWAAVELRTGRVVANPFRPSGRLAAAAQASAEALRAAA